MEAPPIVVHGLPPVWGAPNPSPFVIKLLTWLRMAGIPHELRPLRAPPRSRTKKIPYIELADGELVADSGRIIARLTADRGIDLDDGLDDAARARGHVLRCMIEEHLYFFGLYERFATPEGFAHVRRDYFSHLPFPLRSILPIAVRRGSLKNLHGQGTGRLPRETIAELTRADIAALSALLGDAPYLLGDTPRVVDATGLGFLWTLLSNPFESVARASIESHTNLVAYVARMRARYWSDAEEPAA